jgi:predicted nucleotidyltransferase
MSQREVIDKVRQYCLLLNSSGITVEKAFLFGSWARGDSREESDIDVMIVSSVFDTYNDMLKAKAWRMTENIDLKIEPYTVGLKRFETDDITPLLQIVKKEGIEIAV